MPATWSAALEKLSTWHLGKSEVSHIYQLICIVIVLLYLAENGGWFHIGPKVLKGLRTKCSAISLLHCPDLLRELSTVLQEKAAPDRSMIHWEVRLITKPTDHWLTVWHLPETKPGDFFTKHAMWLWIWSANYLLPTKTQSYRNWEFRSHPNIASWKATRIIHSGCEILSPLKPKQHTLKTDLNFGIWLGGWLIRYRVRHTLTP